MHHIGLCVRYDRVVENLDLIPNHLPQYNGNLSKQTWYFQQKITVNRPVAIWAWFVEINAANYLLWLHTGRSTGGEK